MDFVFNTAGGPVAVLDAVTGGNVSGTLQAGTQAVTSGADMVGQVAGALVTGDWDHLDTSAIEGMNARMLEGDYGLAVQGLAHAGDALGDALSGGPAGVEGMPAELAEQRLTDADLDAELSEREQGEATYTSQRRQLYRALIDTPSRMIWWVRMGRTTASATRVSILRPWSWRGRRGACRRSPRRTWRSRSAQEARSS